MPIDELGFLGDEIDNYFPVLQVKFEKHFQFIDRINRLAQEHKTNYSCNSLDREKTIANCLFIKILNGFQACVILLKKMLPYEARALSRTLCDPLYLLRIFSIENNSGFWGDYLKYGSVNVRKKLNAALRNPHSIFDFTREYVTKDLLDELNEKASTVDTNLFSVEQLAIKAKMQAHYDTVFRYASDEIHTPPNVVFRYVDFDENDEAIGFNWGPKDKDVDRIIVDISDIVIKALAFMDDIHKKSRHCDFEKIVGEWKELDKMTK